MTALVVALIVAIIVAVYRYRKSPAPLERQRTYTMEEALRSSKIIARRNAIASGKRR